MNADMQTGSEYFVEHEPYYVPTGDEVEIFDAAYAHKLPV